ncbi:MAG: EAL domain-containing response regulator [Burkholderiales bacterium]|nr:EAL domain-containing response regulator [Burkholderiales bacterium]
MVVDDLAAQRRLVRDMLMSLGVRTVYEADDGEAALARMSSLNKPVDVIVSDLDMPGMDGVEFIRHLGSRHLASALVLASKMDPALIGSVEAMARVQGLQVLGTLQKPIRREELEAALRRFIPYVRADEASRPEAVTEDLLRAAIEAQEIVPYFQPKVRIADGRMAGAEVLARWQHPEYGMIEPARFIPLAERGGLIEPLTWLMLEHAMEQAHRWQRTGRTWTLSVNLSLNHLEQANVADAIASLADRWDVPHERIVLEVTESLAAQNLAPILGNLARLRLKGFGVAIDDYGTGYSSLEQLSRMPFTELKIDRSFVSGAAHRATLRTILGSSIELARQLNLESVAEGVEHEDDLALLRELGCDLAQGQLISPPLSAEQLEDWLRSRSE